jgi:hypothetical protein
MGGGQCSERAHWRAGLLRELAVLLSLKTLALIVLWALFFSGRHQVQITPLDAAGQLWPATAGVRPAGLPAHD